MPRQDDFSEETHYPAVTGDAECVGNNHPSLPSIPAREECSRPFIRRMKTDKEPPGEGGEKGQAARRELVDKSAIRAEHGCTSNTLKLQVSPRSILRKVVGDL